MEHLQCAEAQNAPAGLEQGLLNHGIADAAHDGQELLVAEDDVKVLHAAPVFRRRHAQPCLAARSWVYDASLHDALLIFLGTLESQSANLLGSGCVSMTKRTRVGKQLFF